MLVRVLCLFLALLTPLLNRLTAGAGKTRCLLVGCDRFVSMPDTTPPEEIMIVPSQPLRSTAVPPLETFTVGIHQLVIESSPVKRD